MTRFDLSTSELDVVWRAGELGPLPLIIDVPSPGMTHTERAAVERRVWTNLVERGLADDHGRVHWRLADRLETIARRRRSLQVHVVGQDSVRAILAVRDRRHVLGVLADRFRLAAVPGTGAASTLLALLPDVPAGQGHSVSVDTTVLTAAVRNPASTFDVLRRHGLGTDDARTLITMTSGCLRTIQIVAETREAEGRTTRSLLVSAHDTPAGRYRAIRTVTAAGDHLTVTPATTSSLVGALTT